MIKSIILNGKIEELEVYLKDRPELPNRAISFGPDGKHQVHPLHFVCDAVFEGKLTEATALEMAKILVAQGADINGQGADGTTTKDSPLIAASSLYCENIAVYLIDQGADLDHRGTHRGTCLHWAAWTGSDSIVARLLQEPVSLDDQDDEFQSTPLLWAVNGWLHAMGRNHRQQPKVMELLLEAGADPNAVDGAGRRAVDILLNKEQTGLVDLLKRYGGQPT